MSEKQFYDEIIGTLKQNQDLDRHKINMLKQELCKKHHMKKIPTNIQILLRAKQDELKKLKHLKTKPTRSISGVAPIALMTAPFKCPHGVCSYCPGGPGSVFGDVPQSYTGKEPSTMRAIRNRYDPYLMVMNRLEQYIVLGHEFEKVDIIIQGGTFTNFPKNYQLNYIKSVYKALNDFGELFYSENKNGESELDYKKFKEFFELPNDIYNKERLDRIHEKLLLFKGNVDDIDLEEEKLKNQNARIRCIGLTIETRADCAKLPHANEMLRFGCTRVEIGVQSVYDEVLDRIHRGHPVSDNIEAIQILKDLGFKLNFHYMPGLPYKDWKTNKERDWEGMLQIFSDDNYKPDMIKIYPCMVFKGTALHSLWKKGVYTPYTTEEATEMISKFMEHIPEYCRVMRVQRDIPSHLAEAGVDKTNLRQYIAKRNPKLREIRAREVGHVYKLTGQLPEKIEIIVREYNSSNGKEFFISAEDIEKDIIVGFVRLRFPGQFLRPEITKDSALIRELHVYGSALKLGGKSEGKNVQHKGWGTKLMQKAEEICKENGKNKLVVISGVGVREYYKNKLGYKLEGPYMTKEI